MKNYVSRIQSKYVSKLSFAAREYLKTGLQLFHKNRRYYYSKPQVPLGILGISIELMLKSFIADKNINLIFTDIPFELKALLSNPKTISNKFKWRQYDIDLQSFTYKTIELDKCISGLFIYRPELKQELKPHFQFISKYRNASVHLVLPSFRKYELDRTVFLSLEIAQLLFIDNTGHFKWFKLEKDDIEFLNEFKIERIERVRKVIESAKEKSRKISHKFTHILLNEWDNFVTKCPICGNDAILDGFTELSGEADDDGDMSPALNFFANSFECGSCGLKLEDAEELKLASIDILYDRYEDLEKWSSEMGDDYEY